MTQTRTVGLLSPPNKYAVVQLPGRQFPGAVIQGDSLFIMFAQAVGILNRMDESTEITIKEDMKELANSLNEVLDYYEKILRRQNLPLPYVSDIQNVVKE